MAKVSKKPSPLDEAGDKVDKLFKRLNPNERKVYDIIYDHIDELPSDFFWKSCRELNEHFGGHDDMVVTENVRAALNASKEELDLIDEVIDIYDYLPQKDEEEYV